jgi:Helix-turn-helix
MNRKHGFTAGYRNNGFHPIYQAWVDMKKRCSNPRFKRFKDYGGRGITVCARWLDSFSNFLEDVQVGWEPGLLLDRYPNNDGNYEPGNVRWATRKESANNQRHRDIKGGKNPGFGKGGEKNSNSKISNEEAKRIFSLRAQGLTLKDIAKVVGLSLQQVSNILSGKSRRDLKPA